MQPSRDSSDVEAAITFIHFEYFNLSETTMNPTVDKIIFHWTNEEIARLIQVIIRPILVA